MSIVESTDLPSIPPSDVLMISQYYTFLVFTSLSMFLMGGFCFILTGSAVRQVEDNWDEITAGVSGASQGQSSMAYHVIMELVAVVPAQVHAPLPAEIPTRVFPHVPLRLPPSTSTSQLDPD